MSLSVVRILAPSTYTRARQSGQPHSTGECTDRPDQIHLTAPAAGRLSHGRHTHLGSARRHRRLVWRAHPAARRHQGDDCRRACRMRERRGRRGRRRGHARGVLGRLGPAVHARREARRAARALLLLVASSRGARRRLRPGASAAREAVRPVARALVRAHRLAAAGFSGRGSGGGRRGVQVKTRMDRHARRRLYAYGGVPGLCIHTRSTSTTLLARACMHGCARRVALPAQASRLPSRSRPSPRPATLSASLR
jgi:hypothetical protein